VFSTIGPQPDCWRLSREQELAEFFVAGGGAAARHPVEDAQPGAYEPVQTLAGCGQTEKNLAE